MKKVALLLLTTAVALLLFACKNGNGNSPDNPLNQKKADMVHKYVITSEKPIDISFIVTTGLDDIFFNGTNEKTSILTKEVKNNGTQEYTIKTRSAMLETATIMSQPEDVEVPLKYEWKAYINGKEVKSDVQTISVGLAFQGKTYVTTW